MLTVIDHPEKVRIDEDSCITQQLTTAAQITDDHQRESDLISFRADFFFDWQSLYNIVMIAAAIIAGWDIAVRAFASLRNRYVSIELLVTIATLGALVIGEYWEAAAVTFLFILGAYLEARTLSQTRQVLKGLLDLAPTTAIVIRNGKQLEIIPLEMEPGETVLVKPGAKIPVDGE